MATTVGTWADHLALLPSAGDVHYFTNSFYNKAFFTGSIWRYFIHGKEVFQPPAFSWVNQTSGGQTATVSSANGGEHLVAPAVTGVHMRLRVIAAPATPFKLTAAFAMHIPSVNFATAGLCWYQSSTQKIVSEGIGHNSGLKFPEGTKWNNPTTFGGGAYGPQLDVGGLAANQLVWFELEDDGSNRIVRSYTDGVNPVQLHSVGRTDFLTASHIGYYAKSENATFPVAVTLISWKVT